MKRKQAYLKVIKVLTCNHRYIEATHENMRDGIKKSALKRAYNRPDNLMDELLHDVFSTNEETKEQREYWKKFNKSLYRKDRKIIRRRSLHDYDERETLAIRRWLKRRRNEEIIAAIKERYKKQGRE